MILALVLMLVQPQPVIDVTWVQNPAGWTPTCSQGLVVVRHKGTPLTEHTMKYEPECQWIGPVLHKGSYGEYQCMKPDAKLKLCPDNKKAQPQ